MLQFSAYNTNIDQLSQRAEAISKLIPNYQSSDTLKTILGLIDLTTLSGDDNTKKVESLCDKGIAYKNEEKGIPSVAAICTYPVFADLVSSKLKNTDLNCACVAGAFPSALSPLELRLKETEYAISTGANEIDMVISRGKLIEGDEAFVFNEISKTKSVCGDIHLKVILETGELKSVEFIRKASEMAINAGGDFLKTSTGKVNPAATPEAFLIMCDTIKEYHKNTGKKIGVKAAGGISTSDEALLYYAIVAEVLGEEWLNNKLFRIGASRLADNLYNDILELEK